MRKVPLIAMYIVMIAVLATPALAALTLNDSWTKTYDAGRYTTSGGQAAIEHIITFNGSAYALGYDIGLVDNSTGNTTWYDVFLKKYLPNGSEDAAFNVTFDIPNNTGIFGYDLAYQAVVYNSTIILAGYYVNDMVDLGGGSSAFVTYGFLKGFYENGTEDVTWRFNHSQNMSIFTDIDLYNDTIYVTATIFSDVNTSTTRLLKFWPNGTWDQSWVVDDDGTSPFSYSSIYDGAIYTVGSKMNASNSTSGYDCVTRKIWLNGTEDNAWNKTYAGPGSFNASNHVTGRAYCYAVLATDSGVYIGGTGGYLWNSTSRYDGLLIKYGLDGAQAWVYNFSGNGTSREDENNSVNGEAIHALAEYDGTILLGGNTFYANSTGNYTFGILRQITPNGEVISSTDTRFLTDSGVSYPADIPYTVMTNDSRIYLGGTRYDGNAYIGFMRAYEGICADINITVNTSLGATYTCGNVYISNRSTLTMNGSLWAANISILENGTITHFANTNNHTYSLNITAENVIIENGSSIDVTGKGYTGGATYTNGNGPSGGTRTGNEGSGGGHAGWGGNANSATGGRTTYGNTTHPTTIGSGGAGGWTTTGRAGGGAIILNTTGTIHNNGQILANGENGSIGSQNRDGGGAGGSIWIITNNLTGTGTISANGGKGANDTDEQWDGGGGGGGRIALYYNTNTLTGTTTAYGGQIHTGANAATGGAGTIYHNNTDTLIIDNGPQGFTTGTGLENIIVTYINLSNCSVHGTIISATNILSIMNTAEVTGSIIDTALVNVLPNATLSHAPNTNIQNYTLNITAGTINVFENGIINLSGRGYAGGAMGGTGYGPGNGTYGGSTGGGGGSNTGWGANGVGGTGGTKTYSNFTNPTTIGSGGGGGCCSTGVDIGGAGGGATTINTTTLNINGSIIANGINGINSGSGGSGGGAGGSILIIADTITGTANITANGGNGGHETDPEARHGGSGGGGSIALYYNNNTLNGSISAKGGTGNSTTYDGGTGTIYHNNTDTLVINNEQRFTPRPVNITGQRTNYLTINITNSTTLFNTLNPTTLNIKENAILGNNSQNAITIQRFNLSGAGTAFVYSELSGINISVSGTGTATFNATVNADNLRIEKSIVEATRINTNRTVIKTGAQLTHKANTNAQAYTLNVTSENLTIETGASINVTARGYAGGAISNPGNGPGNGTQGNQWGGGGASHAGNGANAINSGGLGGRIGYGNITHPTTQGSGGAGTAWSIGGAGGGVVRIIINNTLDHDGSITADGENGKNDTVNAASGGGAGGSIWITAQTMTGTGNISAKGGNAGNNSNANDGGAGGGGRIAIHTITNTNTGMIQTTGGQRTEASNAAGPGTIYYNDTDTLVIDNGAISSTYGINITSPVSFTYVNMTNSTVMGATITSTKLLVARANTTIYNALFTNNMTIVDGPAAALWISSSDTITVNGSLSHPQNTNTHAFSLNITANNINILTGASINVTGKGYSGGATSSPGYGPGNGTPGNGWGGAGASHAGIGINAMASGGLGGIVIYGNITHPSTIGSGGAGTAWSTGSAGGGAIIINTTTLNNNGSITADGENGKNDTVNAGSGGGAGGSVFLVVETIAGTGNVSAIGGNAGNSSSTNDGGAGGGGRISIWRKTNTNTGSISVRGGISASTNANGSDGTIFLCDYASGFSCPGSYGSIALNTIFARNNTMNFTRRLDTPWNSSFVNWTDASNQPNGTATYNITGLNTSNLYKVFLNDSLNQSLLTTADGSLNFSVNTSMAFIIKALEGNNKPSFTMRLNGSKNLTSVFDNENLLCLVNNSDPDDFTNTAYWAFYNGSTLHSNGSTVIASDAEWATVGIVDYQNTAVGENWTCSVIMGDAVSNATAQNDSRVIEAISLGMNITVLPSIIGPGLSYNISGKVWYSNNDPAVNANVKLYVNGTAIGSGSENYVLASGTAIINNYTHLTANATAGATTLTVNSTDGFAATDTILIVQMQNHTAGVSGTYETAAIDSVAGNTITLTSAIVNDYYTGRFNVTNATVTQIVRIPAYNTFDIDAGTEVKAKPWDGYSGGIIALSANTATIDGMINATGQGFRGGNRTPSVSNYMYGFTGESVWGYNATNRATTSNAIQDGGGAGLGADGSGGGGSHAAAGNNGQKTLGSSDYGRGGAAKGNITTLLFGGGGGSAGSHDGGRIGGAGGAGGGIVFINAQTITINGDVVANGRKGENGTYAGDGNSGAGGGGGAGGTVYLQANTLTINGRVNATKGIGGYKDPASGGGWDGGNGSDGRVRLDFTSITGSTNPSSGYNGTYTMLPGACLTDANGEYLCGASAPFIIGPYNISVNTTFDNLYAENSTWLEVVNTNVTFSLAWNGSTAIRTNISCIANIADPDLGQNWTVNWTVKNGTVDYATGQTNITTARIWTTLYTVNMTALNIGDNWNCTANVFDGYNTSPNQSANYTILGQLAPNITSIVVNSTTGQNWTNETLTAYATVNEPNNDAYTLIHDWRLNGTSIAVLNMNFDVNNSAGAGKTRDYTTHGNNGTNSGATWVAAGLNNTGAYNFSAGTDQRVVITDHDSLDNFTQMTIIAWIYTRSGMTSWNGLVAKGNQDSGVGNSWFVNRENTGGANVGKIRFGVENASDTGENFYSGETIDAGYLNEWHMIAFGWNGANRSAQFYKDGVANGSRQYGSLVSQIRAGTHDVWIGDAFSTIPSWNGLIDNVQIYNRELSAQEIAAIYNNQSNTIVRQELSTGQNWTDCVTANDGLNDSNTICSAGLLTRSSAPVINNITINTSLGTYTTQNNISVSSINITSPAGATGINTIYDWRADGTSIAILNMNFDVNNSGGTNIAKGYSSTRYNGTLQNGARTTRYGGVNDTGTLVLDGGDEYVDLGTWFNYQAFTISMWVKPGSVQPHQYADIFDNNHPNNFVLQQNSWTTNEYGFGIYDNNPGSGYFTLPADQWTHLLITRDSVTKNHSVYINGQLNRSAIGTTDVTYSGQSFRLGKWGGGTRYWNGSYDDVRVYNRALSAEQIAMLYNNRTDLLVSQELRNNTQYSVCAVANDGSYDSNTACSNSILIGNQPPVMASVIVNSTTGKNLTRDNLTAYVNATDPENDTLRYAHDWRQNGTSIAVLNMNFDVNNSAGNGKTRDYSMYGNNGTITAAVWNATGGSNGSGAYNFEGVTTLLTLNSGISMSGGYTLETRTKFPLSASGDGWRTLTRGSDTDHYVIVDSGNNLGVYSNGGGGWIACSPGYNVGALSGWKHLVAVGSGSKTIFYMDGVNVCNSSVKGTGTLQYIGNYQGGGQDWGAPIDMFAIYNRSLTPQQVLALYNNRSDLIVSQELVYDGNWTDCVTPNDGTGDGATMCSNSVFVDNHAPDIIAHVLNSTYGTNTSVETLTAYTTIVDIDDDNTSVIHDWRINGTSIAVLNMNFDVENSAGGGKTRDYTVAARNASVYGANWTSSGGWNGTGAYSFDGVGNFLNGSGSLDSDQVTFMAWVNSTSSNNQLNTIFINAGYDGCTADATHYGFMVYVNTYNTNDRRLVVAWGNESSGCNGLTTDTDKVPINTWTHVAVVFDANRTNVSIYLNGTYVNSTGYRRPVSQQTTHRFGTFIGHGGGGPYWYKGIIDEPKVYNRSLSAQEIAAIYNNQSNTIVSQELSLGQNWSACSTPNDGIEDGTTVCSDGLLITTLPDTCTPPGLNNDWNVNASDMCLKTGESIDLGTGILNVFGAGYLRLVGTNVTAGDVRLTPQGGIARIYLESLSRIIVN